MGGMGEIGEMGEMGETGEMDGNGHLQDLPLGHKRLQRTLLVRVWHQARGHELAGLLDEVVQAAALAEGPALDAVLPADLLERRDPDAQLRRRRLRWPLGFRVSRV